MVVANLLTWLTLCTCAVLFCTASPTRRQFLELPETTSSEPAKKAEAWNNDFDLDDDDEWLGEAVVSAAPQRTDYQDYVEEEEEEDDFNGNLRDNEELDNDIEHQDAEEDEGDNEHEFLFIPSKDSRLMLEDDDEQSGPIKVRHTGKNSYAESVESHNSVESSKTDKNGDNDDQFEFTIDKNDDDKAAEVEDEDGTDDFVLEDTPQKAENTADSSDNPLPRRQLQEDLDDDSDEEEEDDSFILDGEEMFETPEEDSQVIYGDHVFLY